MKTFKMLSISLVENGVFHEYALEDGIIINQENSHRMWVLELYIDAKHQETFERWIEEEKLLEARVVISYPENEPAGFIVTVSEVRKIGSLISVLLKGKLKRARTKYAEQLLKELLEEGLEGDALLERFEHDMRERPRLKQDRMLYEEDE
ncbi:hypothetical protein GOP80_01660 [Planococcaceae bacterium Storch 2/2-2]|nr:hypothetical protein [Planococcaceae bacterium Storch 2/2-2]